MQKFPDVQFFAMPHLAAVVVSIATSMSAMAMAFALAVANSELNPLKQEVAGQAHHRWAGGGGAGAKSTKSEHFPEDELPCAGRL